MLSNFDDNLTTSAFKGTLSWGEDKIRELVIKFRDRRLAFIQDTETIDLVKEQLKTGEWSLCSSYLKDKNLKLLVQMGLALRKLDQTKSEKYLSNLRTKILEKYGAKGLHIAEFVQSKILSDFIGSIADKAYSVTELIENVEKLLNNLELNVLFIRKIDNLDKRLNEIKTRLIANAPLFFIIFATKSAMSLGLEIKQNLKKELEEYELSSLEEKNRLLIFLSKKEDDFIEISNKI